MQMRLKVMRIVMTHVGDSRRGEEYMVIAGEEYMMIFVFSIV